MDTDALPRPVKEQRRHARIDVGNAFANRGLDDLNKRLARLSPARPGTNQHTVYAGKLCPVEHSAVNLPGLFNGVAHSIITKPQLRVVFGYGVGQVKIRNPDGTGLVVEGLEQGVRLPDGLGLEGQLHVEEVCVLGADDLVPVPRRAKLAGEGLTVDELDGGVGVLADQVEGRGGAEDARAYDEVRFIRHCLRMLIRERRRAHK